MPDDNPLDRRLSNADAAQLLLAATPATATGATTLTEPDGSVQNLLAGYAVVAPDSTLGSYITEQSNRTDDWDNQTRWTLLDSGASAKVILEIEEIKENRYAIWKGVLSFEYPDDRHCLAVIAETGWLAVAAGDADSYDYGQGHGVAVKPHGDQPPLFCIEMTTMPQLKQILRVMDERNPTLEPIPPEQIVQGIQKQIEQQRARIREQDAKRDEEARKIVLDEIDRTLDDMVAQGKIEKLEVDGETRYRAIVTPDGKPWENDNWLTPADMLEDEFTLDRLKRLVAEKQLDDALDSLIEDGMVEKRGDRYYPIGPNSETRAPRTRDELLADENLMEWLGQNPEPPKVWERTDIDTGDITYIDDKRVRDQTEEAAQAYINLLHKKTPVWAGARGFALAYEEMLRRIRIFREVGNNSDQLTVLHAQIGISMFESHVLTVASAQVNALPKLSEMEAMSFLRGTPLPFNPFFIDFSGDDKLPSMETHVARGGTTRLLGTLCSTQEDHPQALYLTPIWLHTAVDPPYASEPVAYGSLIVNLTDNPNESYYWIGQEMQFTHDSVVCIAWSPLLDRNHKLADEYSRMIMAGAGDAIAVLHLLDFSNIEMVEKTLERREAKRAEKRKWNVPLVVRVSRPSRRVQRGASDGMSEREWTHQWDVIGHPMHFAKVGPMTRCIVCGGKTSDEVPCVRCNNTGLDPEKVSPCTRIDVKTGELTCPNGCRRIWCPPHTKGPEDKPYIPKSRKLV